MKNANSKQNLAVVSATTESEKKLFKYYTEKDKKFEWNRHRLDRNLPLNRKEKYEMLRTLVIKSKFCV